MTEQTMLTKIEQELLAEAMDGCDKADSILNELESPDWERSDIPYALSCGVWESLVPESVIGCWKGLSLEAKLVAYLVSSRGLGFFGDPPE